MEKASPPRRRGCTTAAAVLPRDVEADRETAFFVERIKPEFLAEIRWDPDAQVLSPPQDHPVLGWWVCRVLECGRPTSYSSRLCVGCTIRRRNSCPDVPVEQFARIPRPPGPIGYVARCRVPEGERPWQTAGWQLCARHAYLLRRDYGGAISVEEFIARPEVRPLPGFGPCQVVACDRDRCSASHGHCHMHRVKWTRRVGKGPVDLDHFNRTEPPTAEDGGASLRGRAPLVIAQFLFGLQRRVAEGI